MHRAYFKNHKGIALVSPSHNVGVCRVLEHPGSGLACLFGVGIRDPADRGICDALVELANLEARGGQHRTGGKGVEKRSDTHKVARVVAASGGAWVDFRHLEGFPAKADSSRQRLVSGRGFAMRGDGNRPSGGWSVGRQQRCSMVSGFSVYLVCRWSAKRADVWTQRRGSGRGGGGLEFRASTAATWTVPTSTEMRLAKSLLRFSRMSP